MLEQFNLAGRVALVTGSTRGIGLGIARALAQAGARVLINGRDETQITKVVRELTGIGLDVQGMGFDVTDAEAAAAAVEHVEQAIGPLEILVNNAGIQHRAPLEEFPHAEWDRLMRTNIDSVFFVSQPAAKRMIARRRGKIINVASVQSELARETIAPYAATKGAVKMLTKGMATDWAKYGLNVNAIGPGYFNTELNAALVANPEFASWVSRRVPAGRWAEIDEIGGAAVFLASDASSFVNGQVLFVDGGLSASM